MPANVAMDTRSIFPAENCLRNCQTNTATPTAIRIGVTFASARLGGISNTSESMPALTAPMRPLI